MPDTQHFTYRASPLAPPEATQRRKHEHAVQDGQISNYEEGEFRE
jgi:hypothetical protein